MPRDRSLIVALLVVAALVVGAVWPTPDDGSRSGVGSDRPESTEIAWEACTVTDEDDPDIRASMEAVFADYQCAIVVVPVDYDDPTRGTLELFVQMRPAPAADPIGPLFVNQGGPGASAAAYTATFATYAELDRFDIVGMDPRGTGRSTHLDCGDTPLPSSEPQPPGDDPGTLTAFEEEVVAFAEACASDPNLDAFGSNSAARDMDRLRELMGAEQITYHGKSYGSDLGTAYASSFPERLRAGVFDGVSDLTLDPVDFVAQQTNAGQALVDGYLQRCAEAAATADPCAWTQGQEPDAAWAALLDRLEDEPVVDADTGDELTAGGLREWANDFVGAPDEMRTAALDALVLDGEIEDLVVEDLAESDPDLATAFVAITCLDLPIDDYRDAFARLDAQVGDIPPDPLFTLAACAHWPAADPITVTEADGAGPILVVGTTGDVPTPYASAESLADHLATATLLTWEAESHTAFLASVCVLDEVLTFLVDLTLPAAGTVCRDPNRFLDPGAVEGLAADDLDADNLDELDPGDLGFEDPDLDLIPS
ncbi:alpha/beta hydrolase [Rhabdothermincola salaria]|uniref:alpha/beta hydrolase n=1 Tax=Rhabdothermincola salaria TaxID=2903142 RepID=UPI001E583B6E|nr:alpha/beta hydrolase [Rhabdothermincola salaria]MCD9622808.1 alpha/beta hydrolase [Rhabdothermincola salaria]